MAEVQRGNERSERRHPIRRWLQKVFGNDEKGEGGEDEERGGEELPEDGG